MILTGKAKEDFLIKIYYSEDTNQASDESFRSLLICNAIGWINKQDERFVSTLIVDWFETVGIYVNITLDETNEKKFKYLITDVNIRHLHCWTEGVNKNSRQDATKKAIEKANEIYNTNTNSYDYN